MDLPFELHVALRYLLAKRKQAFISVISLISTLGVTVGVMALVIALALMTGLQGELRDRILGSTAHIYVWKRGGHRRLRTPRCAKLRDAAARGRRRAGDLGQGAAVSEPATSRVHQIKGIDPGARAARSPTSRTAMRQRQPRGARAHREGEMPGILLGKDLAATARRRRSATRCRC